MNTLGYVVAALVGLALFCFIGWGLASRRHAFPCPVWLAWLVELDNPLAKSNRAAVIIERMGLRPGMLVLDAGCGPGRLTIPLAKQVGERGNVVAMDMQSGMLSRVREKAESAGLGNIQYLQAALGKGKLEPNRYDRAVLVTVLGEIPDRASALRELYDTLKPGGILSITETVFDPHYQRGRTVTRLAEEAGFRVKARYGNRLAYNLSFEKPDAG